MMSLVSYGESSSSDSEGEETTVRSGGPQDIRKLLSMLPAPAKGGGKRIRVGVPSLRGPRNDSEDSDSDDPPELKRKAAAAAAAGGGGGLTGLLPKPKQATQTVGKVVKPAQPMIPYTLTKTRRPPPSAQTKRKAKPPRAPSRTADDSDSDGEPVSFFSLSDRTEAPASVDSSTPASHSQSSEPLVGPIPIPDSSTALHDDLKAPDPTPGSTPTVCAGYSETVDTAPTAPKPFSLGEETGWSYPEVAGWGEEQSVDHTPATEVEHSGQTGPLLGVGPGLSMDEKTFRRLTGGKRKRGRDPSLNDLIEIKGDDVKEEIALYRKHNSEEAIDGLYKPPEGEKPTGQQKRKHQLSYLVHEAKANELKLLKQWGASAATRRDTQMKYGF